GASDAGCDLDFLATAASVTDTSAFNGERRSSAAGAPPALDAARCGTGAPVRCNVWFGPGTACTVELRASCDSELSQIAAIWSMAPRDAARVLCGKLPLSLATPGVNGLAVSATRLPPRRLSGPNAKVQPPGRPSNRRAVARRHAGPVGCNGSFGGSRAADR